ncbi:putative leader peptide [Streptomyces aculeolatus]
MPTDQRFFSRHHVDLVRVASALCPRGRLQTAAPGGTPRVLDF